MENALLYPITIEFLNSLNSSNPPTVEAHVQGDEESSDVIWIHQYSDGGMSEGEYLALSPASLTCDMWYVSHNAADICGGHPTYWSKSGSQNELVSEFVKYYVDRVKALS